jgi:hypothetical protein
MTFQEASDGPRILLFGPMDSDVASLQRAFRELSKSCGSVELDKQPFVLPFGGVRLFAKCSGFSDATSAPRPGIYKKKGTMPQFEWVLPSDRWGDLAEFLGGLVASEDPGHQYLTQYPGDDFTVVVSKGEYSDDALAENQVT